jgi:hypothetical protein
MISGLDEVRRGLQMVEGAKPNCVVRIIYSKRSRRAS